MAEAREMREELRRLARSEGAALRQEGNLVRATGTAPAAWTVQIVRCLSYNVYAVNQVALRPAGFTPMLVSGNELAAVNLAEPFEAAGQVPAGTYAVMWRVGDYYVIQITP